MSKQEFGPLFTIIQAVMDKIQKKILRAFAHDDINDAKYEMHWIKISDYKQNLSFCFFVIQTLSLTLKKLFSP